VPEFVSGEQRPLRYRQENLVEWIQIPTAEPLQLELQDFIRCARDGVRPKVSATEALRALTVASSISERIHAPSHDAKQRPRSRATAVTTASRLAAV
jgi:predicted dehydrogenase